VTAILHVGISESLPEAGLFEQRDIDEIRPEKYESPDEVRPGEKNEHLPEKHEYNAGYHRIPHVAIGSANNQTARRIPRCERSVSLGRKSPERRGE